jgi:hypothetical protein
MENYQKLAHVDATPRIRYMASFSEAISTKRAIRMSNSAKEKLYLNLL